MTDKIYSIDDIKNLLYVILAENGVKQAILFGSYAKGLAGEKSDVDILIDSNGRLKGLKFFALIDIIKEALDKEVDVIEKSEIDEGSRIDKEIQSTGVVIYER